MNRYKTAIMSLLLLTLLLGAGCRSNTLVAVTLTGSREATTSIVVLAILNGQESQLLEYPSTVREFGIWLPEGARGELAVLVGGSSGPCLVSAGRATVNLNGDSQIDLTVRIEQLTPPDCN